LRRREEYFIGTDFEDVTGPETRPTWGRGKLGNGPNCKRLSRCESKGERDGCNIVAVGFDRLNLGGCKLTV
jgi:hypothetical protein